MKKKIKIKADELLTSELLAKKLDLEYGLTDEEYGEGNALKIYEALKDQAIVVLAGNPEGTADVLKAAGMEYFIHVKSNVLETLQDFQKKLGITK